MHIYQLKLHTFYTLVLCVLQVRSWMIEMTSIALIYIHIGSVVVARPTDHHIFIYTPLHNVQRPLLSQPARHRKSALSPALHAPIAI